MTRETLIERLRKRAEIRRAIRKEKFYRGKGTDEPDRIADLCDEAADEIEKLRIEVENLGYEVKEVASYIE
jgi:glycosyltransferase A (GT-A) superfamily protein (DUF2064 family)